MAKAALEAGKHVIVREAAGDLGRRGARSWWRWLGEEAAQLHLPQSALLPDGAAHAPHARRLATWARFWWCRAPIRRTGCSTTPTGTGASMPKENGPSRALADIGSHWCDMAEHVTGQRITSLCADLQTFHKTRKQPKGPIETFAGKTLTPEDYDGVAGRYRGLRRGDVPHGRAHARRVHGQPGFGGPQEPAEHRDLRHQVAASRGTRSGPTSCGSATATRPTRSSSRIRRC